jgi:hypothetical protein
MLIPQGTTIRHLVRCASYLTKDRPLEAAAPHRRGDLIRTSFIVCKRFTQSKQGGLSSQDHHRFEALFALVDSLKPSTSPVRICFRTDHVDKEGVFIVTHGSLGFPSTEPRTPVGFSLGISWHRRSPRLERPLVPTLFLFASFGKSVGNGELQRGVPVRNLWNFLQVESKDRC